MSNPIDYYKSLREWYFARLRKHAYANSQRLIETPSELINADRKLLEAASEYLNPDKETKSLLGFMSKKNIGRGIDKDAAGSNSGRTKSNIEKPNFLEAENSRLKASLQKYEEAERLILEYSPNLLFILTENLEFRSLNFRCVDYTGYSLTELQKTSFNSLLLRSQKENCLSQFAEVRQSRKEKEIELAISCKSGQRKFLSVVIEWSESLKLFFCEARDLTTEKEMEQLKRAFIAMCSHDLRAPLGSMEMGVDLFLLGKYGTLPDAAVEKLQMIQRNIRRLIKLSTDLLDLDRSELGELKIEKSWIATDDLLKRALIAVDELARSKMLCIEMKSDAAQLYCDPERIIQILVNLLSNAIKFSPDNSKIIVRVENLGEMVELSVSDTGPGIEESELVQIFEPFKQAGNATSRKKGIGLGLAICKSLAELHGGRIGVSSRLGKGSKFWIRIPNFL